MLILEQALVIFWNMKLTVFIYILMLVINNSPTLFSNKRHLEMQETSVPNVCGPSCCTDGVLKPISRNVSYSPRSRFCKRYQIILSATPFKIVKP